jgi:hypothetical protein
MLLANSEMPKISASSPVFEREQIRKHPMQERQLVTLKCGFSEFANNIGIRVMWYHSDDRPEK